MPFQVIMPKLSDAMVEGRVLQWLKKEGDRVQGGDVLASIETDKAEIELEAFGAGVLRKILAGDGQTVPVGQLIAVIAEQDEDISNLLAAAPTPPVAGAPAPSKIEAKAAAPGAPAAVAAAPAAEEGWVPASPIARRMAREAGVDLAHLKGSGPGGRILERDVEAYLGAQAQRMAGAEVPVGEREFEDKDLSTMRKTIAARMVQSKSPIPHFTVTVEADMVAALELRKSLNAMEAGVEKLSVNDIVIKATALALQRHPGVNAKYHDGRVRLFSRVHMGIAVAVEDGLIVPVIRDCDRKSLGEIAQLAKGLIDRARARKLRPEEYSGGTFAISNLGMFEVVEFTAVIDPAHGAILAVGAIQEKPVAMNGQITVRQRMRLTGAFDHRIIDGAMGARFLQDLKKILENPVQLLL
jgi:pyruvate dehydrogenase E2 component (dihydrolipoamide acetyltransferase)